ncbi:anti-sigma factor antagonist [Microbacterium nanhaiense]|uniref:Anti-sigma factor antagonist n=1 Tax=Microbacterium nanhaiense TaxID=1301026 RepID=A0ABQ2N357_9MICO|nr:STAS domain-containing protein [Microbacterium nanhaiense]GGO65485.1 anti-sigma factor antagonist [Microbacterium nanhaiense]
MTISTEERGSYAVIRVEGRLVASSAPAFRSSVQAAVDGGSPRVAVDLAAASFVDSSGLGALISGLKTARLAGGDLRITAVPESVRTVLRLTNLDRVLHAYETPEAAFDAD